MSATVPYQSEIGNLKSEMPLVSCLTATYGRFSHLRVALACFMSQDYPNRELIILNNHPVPFHCDEGRVFVINCGTFVEPHYPTLGDCRNRLLELARGEFVRTWDDDDLYLPWTLSQGVAGIMRVPPQDSGWPAFKPARSWSARGYREYELLDNVFEAAMLVRADVARKYGYKPASGGDEHSPIFAAIAGAGGGRKVEMGWRASYVSNWDIPLWRISGSLGSDTIGNRTRIWMEKNQDTGDGQLLTPDFDGMRRQLWALLAGASKSLTPPEVNSLKEALNEYL